MSPKYRDLKAPPKKQMAEIVRTLREQSQSSKTGAAGVKDLGENGDVVWPGLDADGVPVQKSVKRFSVELSDTTEQAAALAVKVEQARLDVEAARERLEATETELDQLDTRVTDVDETSAKRVSAGSSPPTDAPLGAQWITPAGHLYVRIPCEEVPDAV